jgi:hypothetical protein
VSGREVEQKVKKSSELERKESDEMNDEDQKLQDELLREIDRDGRTIIPIFI